MIDRLQVNLRLDRDLVGHLDELAGRARLDRTEMARLILDEGIARHREEYALQDYIAGNVTAWRAAELAGISLYDMLDRIHDRHVIHELDPEELDAIRGLRGDAGDAPSATRRVAEQPAVYRADAESGIAELRTRYRPESVRILFVGESSPAGGTHFYRANSNLFRSVREAFSRAIGPDAIADGIAFLAYFADQGCWLVDLADEPVNRMADRQRRDAVEAGVERLASTIRETRPDRIVAVKSTVAHAVQRAADAAGWVKEVDVLPFPVRQWRQVFVDRLAALLAGESAADGSPSRDGPALTQRVTVADLGRGQIRIPSAGKSYFPRSRGRVEVLLRGRRFDAHYDPHFDPDQERSGVLRIGKVLPDLVRPDERLTLGRSAAAVVTLD